MSEEKFVYFVTAGGLGNQMFEYAAAYAIAKAKGAKLYITNCTDNPHNKSNHNYVKKLFLRGVECSDAPGECQKFFHKDFFPWDPNDAPISCQLHGHFQYYPALVPILDDILEDFRKGLEVGERTDAIFFHIRRGDYVSKSNFHFLQGKDYYLKSYLDLIRKLQKIPEKVYVFSDDIEWCKEQDWMKSIKNLEFFEEEDELKALAKMATCGGGAIIANSTFSWWGAILSKTQHVYYPSRWIGCPVYDLFPSNWICIETTT